MQRLELIVRERGQDDRRKVGWCLNPSEQVLDAGSQLVSRRRRHEARCVEASTARTDDHNPIAEASCVAELAARASHEGALQLAQHAERERPTLRPRERQFSHLLEVEDLAELCREMGVVRPVGSEHVSERRIGSLERARALGLASECGTA
jgi:hypothetical protein